MFTDALRSPLVTVPGQDCSGTPVLKYAMRDPGVPVVLALWALAAALLLGSPFLYRAGFLGAHFWTFVAVSVGGLSLIAGVLSVGYLVWDWSRGKGVAPDGASERRAATISGGNRVLRDVARFNELIEEGDAIAQSIVGRGSADASDAAIVLWRTTAESYIDAYCDRSSLTDFRTIRTPMRPNKMAQLTTAGWERLNRVMAQVEVLRACRDSVHVR